MEKLTIHQSTIHGAIHGKPVMATFRTSPPGLRLPPGQYVLRPPVDNPVYGLVMSLEPVPHAATASRQVAPSAIKVATGPQTTAPAGIKVGPRAVPTVRAAPAIKFDSPAIKFDSPAIKFDSPAIKWDTGAGGAAQSLVVASRPIAGSCLVVTAGLGDLVDALQRTGGLMLVVE